MSEVHIHDQATLSLIVVKLKFLLQCDLSEQHTFKSIAHTKSQGFLNVKYVKKNT